MPNVKKSLPPSEYAYPDPDGDIRNYLSRPKGVLEYKVKLEYVILLKELFKHVHREVQKLCDSGKQPPLVEEWREFLSKNRRGFYKNVAESVGACCMLNVIFNGVSVILGVYVLRQNFR